MQANGWGAPLAIKTDESDWGSLNPSASEGWDAAAPADWGASTSSAGWSVAAVPANPRQEIVRKEGPPPPRDKEDDAAAAKEVDKLCSTALDGKKKIAALRIKMDEMDAKRAAIQSQIDELMPELHEIRAQKGSALGVVQGARLPQVWMDKARELNTRRKTLPGGCTTSLELARAIKETEEQISHGSLSLKEEKAALERVRELNRGKAVVKQYELEQLELDHVRQEYSSQQAELKPVAQNLDQLKAAALEKGAVMDKMMASREEAKEARAATSATMLELRSKLDSCFERVRSHQADAPKAVARFFTAVRELDAKLTKDRPNAPAPTGVPAAVAAAPAGADLVASLPPASASNGVVAADTAVEPAGVVAASSASVAAPAVGGVALPEAAAAAPELVANGQLADDDDGEWKEVGGSHRGGKSEKDKKAKAEAKKAREKAKKAAARAERGEDAPAVGKGTAAVAAAAPAAKAGGVSTAAPAAVVAPAAPKAAPKPPKAEAPKEKGSGAKEKKAEPKKAASKEGQKKAGKNGGKKGSGGKSSSLGLCVVFTSVAAVVVAAVAFMALGMHEKLRMA